MNSIEIAQQVLTMATKVTMPGRRGELQSAFREAGIGLSDDGATVTQIQEPAFAVFKLLMQYLAPLPVSKIAAKKTLASNNVIV
jgi:hypothetical protein